MKSYTDIEQTKKLADVFPFHIKGNINDKCKDCPFNDTSCPGGLYCNKED